MPCLCDSINTAKKDMEHFEDILSDIRYLISEVDSLSESYIRMFSQKREAYHLKTEDFDSMEKTVKDENSDVKVDLEEYKSFIENQMDKLDRKITSMEFKDDDYHNGDED